MTNNRSERKIQVQKHLFMSHRTGQKMIFYCENITKIQQLAYENKRQMLNHINNVSFKQKAVPHTISNMFKVFPPFFTVLSLALRLSPPRCQRWQCESGPCCAENFPCATALPPRGLKQTGGTESHIVERSGAVELQASPTR